MIRNVLFVCTGNCARSVLLEATLNACGSERFRAWSAGSQPTGFVHPLALALLQAKGIATTGLRSKSWDAFAGEDAPCLDLVVTVCDSAAAEMCPVFFGDFHRTHWGLPDPARVEGSEDQRRAAFAQAQAVIERRLLALLAIPEDLWAQPLALSAALDRIGALGSPRHV